MIAIDNLASVFHQARHGRGIRARSGSLAITFFHEKLLNTQQLLAKNDYSIFPANGENLRLTHLQNRSRSSHLTNQW
jgi:hypothetical protein